jgi:hypothetical protein
MNIFILDRDPVAAAQMQCNKHVVKMTLETAQLLSSAVIMHGGKAPYRLTHRNHPCTLWASKNVENFRWLVKHGLALGAEYTLRFGKLHKSEAVIREVSSSEHYLPVDSISEFAIAMPAQYHKEDPVAAYRAYYIGEKSTFAKWSIRAKPFWLSSNL